MTRTSAYDSAMTRAMERHEREHRHQYHAVPAAEAKARKVCRNCGRDLNRVGNCPEHG